MLLSGTRGKGLSQHLGLSLSSDPSLIPLESKKHFFFPLATTLEDLYIVSWRKRAKGRVESMPGGLGW